jgi:hypothetical protein
MKIRFLLLLDAALVCALPGQAVRADMAPPTELLVVLGGGTLLVLGGLVAGIVLISILVIREFKKKLSGKEGS